MALKNSTGFRVTSRDFMKACDPKEFTAENIAGTISFNGILDNKINADVSITMKVNGYEVELVGQPLISLNHFELRLTGNSAKLSPEEEEKVRNKIAKLQALLAEGIMPTEEELNS